MPRFKVVIRLFIVQPCDNAKVTLCNRSKLTHIMCGFNFGITRVGKGKNMVLKRSYKNIGGKNVQPLMKRIKKTLKKVTKTLERIYEWIMIRIKKMCQG